MSRTEDKFKNLSRPCLVTFITAGDPDHETSLSLLKQLPGAGADIIELGMPFTDPMADGPAIQEANQRALQNGANMHKTLDMVYSFRQSDEITPLVLMGYTNPVLAYGPEKFASDAAQAGVDGVIIVDLPPEEETLLQAPLKTKAIDFIRLLTPTTDETRLQKLLPNAGGFLYYVSITGVTGSASANIEDLRPRIADIKTKTNLPVAIGFGIKTPEDAKAMGQIADAVVVGSTLIETLKNQGVNAVLDKVKELSSALQS